MSVGKRILKGMAWFLGGGVALVVVAYLGLLAINWSDRPPSAAARYLASMDRNRPKVADADNGYVYVMGFAAERSADPYEAGVRRVAWLRKNFHERRISAGTDPVSGDPSYKTSRARAAQGIVDACTSVAQECVAALESGEAVMREWVTSEQWLLDRYLALLQRSGWAETVPFDISAPLPSYSMVFDGQKLLLARAYLLAAEKDAVGVHGLLAADVKFWRHVLASSDILITKMIAVAALNRHFEMGNLVLRRLPTDLQMTAMPPQWSVPLSDEERSMLRTFAGEWLFGERLSDEMVESGAWDGTVEFGDDPGLLEKLLSRAFRPMYKPQDTSNLRAEMFVRGASEMNVPFDQLPQAFVDAGAVFDAPLQGESHLGWLYNPTGKLLVLAWASGFTSYGARVADVEGSRRAAVLATELRSRKVDLHHVVAEIGASPLRVPYDGSPFAWDDDAQAIQFSGLVPRERGLHLFKY